MKKIKQILNKIREKDAKLIKAKKCICCNRKLALMSNIDSKIIGPLAQEELVMVDGTICRINTGYGSKYDTRSFYIAICDDCISAGLKKGTVEDIERIKEKAQFHKYINKLL